MPKSILNMTHNEIKNHILEIQLMVQNELSKGINIDDFLDKTPIFDDFEDIIPEAEFGIFVLTILNNYKSEIILDKLAKAIETSLHANKNLER
tara:strand:+ start:310 stop:588 length:279 start_codon:yes stop_codon:yes gene_type:complete